MQGNAIAAGRPARAAREWDGPVMASNLDSIAAPLLTPTDPDPVTIVNEAASMPVLLVCEHGGQAVPAALGDLGLGDPQRSSHIGWDIGAEQVARRLSDRLGAPLVIQNYSRLVIDCNRPPSGPDSIPELSHGVTVPANLGLRAHERQRRIDEIFAPFDTAVARLLADRSRKAAFAIHSFNPVLAGVDRHWDMALLYRQDATTSPRLRDAILAIEPDLVIGMNEPYAVDDATDWFVPRHAERIGLAHSLIEVRNDHIADPAGQDRFAALVGAAIETILAEV